MRIQLSDHFTYGKLFRFTLPSIAMMVFTSVYSLVDGFFVSNFVGKIPFAAINLVTPAFTIVGSLGVMVGTGGTAIIGKTLGEQENEKANEYFSMLIYVVLGIGVLTAIVGWFAVGPLSMLLGAKGQMLKDCILYGRILFVASPFFILQFSVQSFFVTAEKPKLGLFVTVFGGVMNIALDALFIVGFKWDLVGAGLATALSQTLATTLALIYFACPNKSLLRLTSKTKIYGKVLLKSCANGSSEMIGNIAFSIIDMLYNRQLLRFFGEDGVAAFGVLLYVGLIFSAIFSGFVMGSAPIVSYNFGAKNHSELKNIFHKSMILVGGTGTAMWLIATLSAPVSASVFVGYDAKLYDLTYHAIQIYSISFIFMGFAVFGSSFFTALNDGGISAAISFIRAFVFEIVAIYLLPILIGPDGMWWAVVASEFAALLLTSLFLIAKRGKYHYV